jgi:hypothetical protein
MSDDDWEFLKKWVERLKIVIWIVSSFIGGLTAAWYIFSTYVVPLAQHYATTLVNERFAGIRSYEGKPDTKIVAPGGFQLFDAKCDPGDIPMSFTVSPADINQTSPLVQSSSNIENGFQLRIANVAGTQRPPGAISATAQCISVGAGPPSH